MPQLRSRFVAGVVLGALSGLVVGGGAMVARATPVSAEYPKALLPGERVAKQ